MLSTKKSVLKASNLAKTYRYGNRETTVFAGVNIDLVEEKNLVILGPSGCGKSTLLNVLSLLDLPDSGDLFLLGEEYASASESKRRRFREHSVGFIFQSFHLIPEMSVLQNTALPGHLAGTPKSQKRAQELLNQVGLGDLLHQRPSLLSGGEKQRVGIARALFHCPKFLFADEPTGNLDTQTGLEVMKLVRQTCQKNNSQLILVTHDNSLIESEDQVLRLGNKN